MKQGNKNSLEDKIPKLEITDEESGDTPIFDYLLSLIRYKDNKEYVFYVLDSIDHNAQIIRDKVIASQGYKQKIDRFIQESQNKKPLEKFIRRLFMDSEESKDIVSACFENSDYAVKGVSDLWENIGFVLKEIYELPITFKKTTFVNVMKEVLKDRYLSERFDKLINRIGFGTRGNELLKKDSIYRKIKEYRNTNTHQFGMRLQSEASMTLVLSINKEPIYYKDRIANKTYKIPIPTPTGLADLAKAAYIDFVNGWGNFLDGTRKIA